ncbi:MAG: sensor histidine kinase [Frankiales bacterium]|nr:sensor histidine kinase [Frankiales bacterium]
MRGRQADHSRPARLGIRVRTTATATAIVAAALVLGGVLLVVLVHRSLVDGVDKANHARARDVAALATAGRLQPTLTSFSEESSVVQVVTAAGHVLAASPNISGEAPIVPSPPGRRVAQALSRDRLPIGQNQETYRMVAEPVTLKGGGPGWVYVATSLRAADATTTTVAMLLGVGAPVLLGLVGLVTWLAVGRALRPVERMRAQAAAIDGSAVDGRVPVPASRDEIARLATTLNEMLQRLADAGLRQRRFVGDASHELRSPLTALRAQVDVALAHPDPVLWGRVLGRVQQQAERMTELIDDLLFLARSEEGAARPDRAVDLEELVLAEASRLRALGGPRVEVAGLQPARVHGSELDLGRLLRNLGDNAAAHSRTAVRLGLTVADGQAELSVLDDGPGIPAADRDRVFDRFTRLSESRSRPSTGAGAGLGLAIALQIVTAHQGSIAVGDRPDGAAGAVFVVRLPLVPAPEPADARAEQDA